MPLKPGSALTEIFRALFENSGGLTPAGIDPGDITALTAISPARGMEDVLRLFLSLLCASGEHREEIMEQFKETAGVDKEVAALGSFLAAGYVTMTRELEEVPGADSSLSRDLEDLARFARESGAADVEKLQRRVRNFFFPEGDFDTESPQMDIQRLREKRKVLIDELNDDPLTDPSSELVITSNILLTVPSEEKEIDELKLPFHIREHLKEIMNEEQLYWYDHPIQLGTDSQHNEIIYGLRNLDRALAFEKERGTLGSDEKITCLLSLSCTHSGLQHIAREYLEHELSAVEPLENLELFAFTEEDCQRLAVEVILPAAEAAGIRAEENIIREIFGVDGEYGRHYTFLKAVTALWQVCRDTKLKGTFKIDLDQVFPQKELVRETGKSALEHFASPLWGARGRDNLGRPVFLGMIAGALVNEKDIASGLFTPDVTFGKEKKNGESLFFYSGLPQALSTEAEMMTRGNEDPEADWQKSCIHRIHVTGGTNGILVDALRRYRPFTPGFIGRAEDQAYILSVLFSNHEEGSLRYCHQPGLIMRHDKEAFAGEAIEAARIGKLVGDYVRILFFSWYAGALGRDIDEIKEVMDPFTGSFISKIPFTVVLLRFVFRACEFFDAGETEDGEELCRMASGRLKNFYNNADASQKDIARRYAEESRGWNLYYDILEALEVQLVRREPHTVGVAQRARDIIDTCHIEIAEPLSGG